jgi:hypothetical protein
MLSELNANSAVEALYPVRMKYIPDVLDARAASIISVEICSIVRLFVHLDLLVQS